MRCFYAVLFFLTLINFSGSPELLSLVLGEEHAYCAWLEEETANEDQQEKNKEDSKENEKEDVKESLLAGRYRLQVQGSDESILARNRRLLVSGHVSEDHSPPPEAA